MYKKFTLKIILSLFVFISVGCTDRGAKKLVTPINSYQLDHRHDLISSALNNNCSFDFNLSETYKNKGKLFNQQETRVFVKGDNFGDPYVGDNIYYYEVGQFNHDNNIYKLITYKKTGEADTPLLNVQLNSYDRNGNLVDALLVDSFFCYEDIVRFSDFIINTDYMISIDDYVIYRYKVDEHGLGEEIKNPIPQTYLKKRYQIKDGRFELTSRIDSTKE